MLVGGGKPALPADVRAELELMDERGFTNGIVYLRYRIPFRRHSRTERTGYRCT